MGRAGPWALAALVGTALVTPGLWGQGPDEGVRRESVPAPAAVRLDEWGLESGRQIRFGELSFAPEADRPVLRVTSLRSVLPPAPPSGTPGGRVPELADGRFALEGFTGAGINRLGGYFTTFQRAPSWSRTELGTAPDRRPALELSWSREESGFAGLTIPLFKSDAPAGNRVYLDGREFESFAFWIRGERASERLTLKAADARWYSLGDALPLGDLGSYLPDGRIRTRWQRALIPMADLPPRLDRSTLASLVLEGARGADQRVFVTAPVFLAAGAEPPPLPPPGPAVSEDWPTGTARTTWVWNTSELLRDSAALTATLEELDAWAVDEVYLQIPVDADRTPAPDLLAPIVAALSKRGIASWALDGDPRHALAALHGRVLTTVEAVARHNGSAPPEQRFVGIRHDIEPYLLPGFASARRDAIVADYLDIVARTARRAREAGLRYGLDIPFWYDAPQPWDPRGVTADFAGERKPVSHHLLDLADEVAVMSYRTRALGGGGALALVVDEMAYAERVGRRVLIGLESGPLLDEVVVEFQGEPQVGTAARPDPGTWIAGWAAGDSLRFALVEDGVSGIGPEGLEAERAPRTVFWWPVTSRSRVEGGSLSFAFTDPEEMRQVALRLARLLSGNPAFAGIALHHSGSLAELRGRSGGQ